MCAIRTVKDAVEFFDPVSNQPQKVPLTRELLRSAKMTKTRQGQGRKRETAEEKSTVTVMVPSSNKRKIT